MSNARPDMKQRLEALNAQKTTGSQEMDQAPKATMLGNWNQLRGVTKIEVKPNGQLLDAITESVGKELTQIIAKLSDNTLSSDESEKNFNSAEFLVDSVEKAFDNKEFLKNNKDIDKILSNKQFFDEKLQKLKTTNKKMYVLAVLNKIRSDKGFMEAFLRGIRQTISTQEGFGMMADQFGQVVRHAIKQHVQSGLYGGDWKALGIQIGILLIKGGKCLIFATCKNTRTRANAENNPFNYEGGRGSAQELAAINASQAPPKPPAGAPKPSGS